MQHSVDPCWGYVSIQAAHIDCDVRLEVLILLCPRAVGPHVIVSIVWMHLCEL